MTSVHTVQKGESLWTIVRNNYNCTTNQQINDMVDEIIKNNKDVVGDGSIFSSGMTITLPENDFFIKDEPDNNVIQWNTSDNFLKSKDFQLFG